jgi:uncharacterized protein YecE (DUF72 family)
MAQHLPQHLYLGTSSWTFPGWVGLVYNRATTTQQLARQGLAAYAQHPLLRTVGIDRSYYAPLTTTDFAAYAAAVPDDFRFLVKAHELCMLASFTSRGRYAARRGERNPLFLDPGYATEQVIGPCVAGLGNKAGPVLFQFPPQDVRTLGGPEPFAERLQVFLRALPRGVLYAVELRNVALLTPAYGNALAATGTCHCFNVHPSMLSLQEQQRRISSSSAPALIVRWMLHPTQRYEAAAARYQPFDRLVDEDPGNRHAIATLCVQTVQAGHPAFVIVNNKAEGSAPLTVGKLAECMAQMLCETHRHL